MSSLPRVLTVDPTGTITQIVRGAIDLTDRLVIHVNAPGGEEAIAEVQRGGYNLVVTAWEPDETMKGWELAAHLKRVSEETAVIILAEGSDPEMDEETQENSPFLYMQRPLEPHQFIRVMNAALDGKDIFEAKHIPAGGGGATPDDLGPVPAMDLNYAQNLIGSLLTDLGALSILLVNRAGEVIQEHGASSHLDQLRLANALIPLVTTNMEVKDIVGGNASALQFFDGDEHDIYVLSVGLHHFMCVVFDGENGSRQFGAVNRYGRRAAEDLIALLGPAAWMIQKPEPADRRKPKAKPQAEQQEDHIELARAEGLSAEEAAAEEEAVPVAESTLPQLEAIDDSEFDPDALFNMDLSGEDDLFDLNRIEEIAKENDQSGTLDWDQAMGLGLIGND